MAEDKKMEHQHDFDGIEELDNDLPRWWLSIFWVTIGFAFLYVPYFHIMNPDKLPVASHEKEVAEITAARAAVAEKKAEEAGDDPEAALMERFKAGGWEASAQTDYNTFCMACHAVDGGGGIGPNFTDELLPAWW